jgi:hypothetical protein
VFHYEKFIIIIIIIIIMGVACSVVGPEVVFLVLPPGKCLFISPFTTILPFGDM